MAPGGGGSHSHACVAMSIKAGRISHGHACVGMPSDIRRERLTDWGTPGITTVHSILAKYTVVRIGRKKDAMTFRKLGAVLCTMFCAFTLCSCESTSSMSFEEFKTKLKEFQSSGTKEKCDQCKGSGQVKCPHCNGSGKIVCNESTHEIEACNGTGKCCCRKCQHAGEICDRCKGVGKVTKGVAGWLARPLRPAARVAIGMVCPFFMGTGKRLYCNGTSKHPPCKLCNGKGFITCSWCEGTGNWPCPECRGSGVIHRRPTLAQWKATFGEPTKMQVIGGTTYYYYLCKDGLIQIEMVLYRPGSGGGPFVRAGTPNLL